MTICKTHLVAGAAMAALAVGALATPSLAFAQEGAELQEVVVTAQRRAERLEEVPLSIAAVNEASLAATGIVKFQELGQITSGVQIARIGPYSQPAIRGVSSSLFGNGLENNVAVYIDGIYQPDSMALNGDLANIQGIEILKGPQGTLYGRNATGGAILVNTKAPSYERLTGRIGAGYGNLNDRSFNVYLTGPITDNVAFSIAGSSRENHGYIRDIGTVNRPELDDQFWTAPYKSQLFRAKLEAKPAEWATITLAYNYAKISDARGNVWVKKAYQLPSFNFAVNTTEMDKSSIGLVPLNSATTNEYTLTGKFDTPIGALSTYLAYTKRFAHLKYDFDGQKVDLVSANQSYPEQTYQAAFDYAIDVVDRLNLVVGANYYNDVFTGRATQFSNNAVTVRAGNKRKDWAYAAYADATYQLTDKLFVTGGVRYSHEKQSIVSVRIPGIAVTTPIDATWSATTFRAVARYEVAERTNVYASFSQGFKSGTFNVTSAFGTLADTAPVKNEDIDAYEIGFKTARGAYRFNAAAYYYDYTNFQVSLTTPVDPNNPNAGVRTFVGNAPAAEVYGAEANIEAAFTSDFNVRAGVAYTHGRYKDYPTASGTGLNPVSRTNATGQIQDVTGLRMLRAPTWTANLGADYTLPLYEGSLKLAGNAYFSSAYIPNNVSVYGPLVAPDLRRKQRYVSPKYATLNVSAAWTAPGDQLTLTAYVNNVTDERHQLIHSGAAFGDYKMYTDPRLYGVRITYDF
jgi:iron complex outermembrane receptor protein